MKDDEAREAIQHALATVAPEADLDEVGAGERLRDALDLDSLDFLSLVERLHEITGVEIPEADYGKVSTVAELSAYLLAHAG